MENTILTGLQEDLIDALKSLNIPIEISFSIMMSLETVESQVELARWLRDNLERRPSAEEIVNKTSEILNSVH